MAYPLKEAGGYKGLSPEQKKVIRKIINIGHKRGESGRNIVTALITGAQESGLTNPRGGDADSEGWRQERRMYYKDPTNLNHSINRFYDELKTASGSSVGERAQSVQGSAYPSAYQPHVAEARRILKVYNRSHKGGRQTGSQRPTGGVTARASKTVSIPGTSFAGQRKLAALDFIKHRFEPGAVEEFAAKKNELQDIPGQTVTIPGVKGTKKTKVTSKAKGPLAEKVARESKGAPSGNAIQIGTQVAKKFGLTVTSTTGGTHVSGSYHYQDRAIDISGSPAAMAKAFKYIQKNVPHGKLTELFYDPIGHYWDNGQKVSGAIGGHDDHVHLAI